MAIFSDVLGGYTSEDLLPGIEWQESRGSKDPNLLGPMTKHGQAIGAYQVLPSTARYYGVSEEQLHDPKTNRWVAKQYLDDLLRHYGGNGFMALAAYNAGQTNIDKGIFPQQTQEYVSQIMGYSRGEKAGRRYATPPRPTPPGNPQMFAARYAPDPSKTSMPPIDYGSIDPNTPMGMLFQSMGAPVGQGGPILKAGEPDLTKIPERKGLFQRLI